MTDTEKLELIDRTIANFWDHDYGDKVSYTTLINCITSIIDFQGGKK